MTYRIECEDIEHVEMKFIAYSRRDLLDWLKILKDDIITDIRKLYKSGVSDSVMEKYEKYIGGGK